MSYCLVSRGRSIEENCPCCGCPAGSHIVIDPGQGDGRSRFLCVACDYMSIEKEVSDDPDHVD